VVQLRRFRHVAHARLAIQAGCVSGGGERGFAQERQDLSEENAARRVNPPRAARVDPPAAMPGAPSEISS
jgi:hypothetical protein